MTNFKVNPKKKAAPRGRNVQVVVPAELYLEAKKALLDRGNGWQQFLLERIRELAKKGGSK